MKYPLFNLLLIFLVAACNSNSEKTDNANTPTSHEQTAPSLQNEAHADAMDDDPHLAKIKEIILLNIGSNLLNSVELNEGVASISYLSMPSGGKEDSKQSASNYWESAKRMEKLMCDLPLRIMLKTGFVNRVKLSIPSGGSTYRQDVSKDQLAEFTGNSLEELANDYQDSYLNKYVRKPEGRAAYIKQFVKKE